LLYASQIKGKDAMAKIKKYNIFSAKTGCFKKKNIPIIIANITGW
jgi:hypothetical protein